MQCSEKNSKAELCIKFYTKKLNFRGKFKMHSMFFFLFTNVIAYLMMSTS